MSIQHFYTQTVADGTATSVVRPSDWNSAHQMLYNLSGNTLGSSRVTGADVILQGGNNVTLSADTAASKIIFVGPTVPAQTVQTQNMVSVQGSTGAISFGNANGITFGGNASTITASHNGLTSQSNQAASAANGSFNFQTLSFANSNGVSFSTGTQGIFATVATNYLTTARASTDAIGLNTAQTNVTWTVNSSGLSLNAAGYAGTGTTFNGTNVSASATLNSNGLNLALSAAGGGVINQTGPNIAAGTQTATSGTVVFADSNGMTFGMSNNSQITASFDPINIGVSTGGNTAGTTGTIDGRAAQFLFHGGNNITLSQSINGQSATLSIVGAAGGGGGQTISFLEPNPPVATSLSSFGQNTLNFTPFKPMENVSMTAIRMLGSINNATSSISHAVSQTISYGLYSLGTGTNNTRIESMATSSMAIIASYSSNLSGGYTISQGANSTTWSSAGTGSTSAWTGQRILDMPFATSVSLGGEYYFCIAQSTASVGGTGPFRMSHVVLNNQTNGSYGRMGPNQQQVSATSIFPNYNGFIFSATSNAWPANIALSQRSVNSNIRAYFQLDG